MKTQVLVVGGGLAGTSAALFLAWRGVDVTLVEKHPGSSPHPRAVGFNARVGELLRAVGLEQELPASRMSKGFGVRRVRAESLVGKRYEETFWTPPAELSDVEYSPVRGVGVAQDRMEPILRDKARELGADIRMSTRMLEFAQDDEGVTAVVQGDGEPYEIRADYLVAADGHRSPVREQLGITRTGRGFMHTSRSVLFRAPLDEYLKDGIGQFVIDDVGFLTTYGDGRWVLMLDDREYTEPELRQKIFQAIGRDDLDVEIITTGRWTISASVADRFGQGRVFLAGDAAHTLPPSRGGFGANVGIEDAHNLAWKLAAVLTGESRPSLLDTYDAERRPVATLCHQQIFARNDGHNRDGQPDDGPLHDNNAMHFGVLYRSAAVLGAGPDLPPAQLPEQWNGQPGTRAPHVWVEPGKSTLDLFQRGWVLVANDELWADAAKPLNVRYEPVARLDAFGLSEKGASLIRPDGYVAWRATDLPDDPERELAEAFRTSSAGTR
ncbi:2,4-dichlorophenol 6-monooxygenase [Lentzea guizhouensis]|uniref:2,4-dichlorophenol 6-monooxygenase n=1 Tax=Lentzea guizhouensis TaxID=1586287 RepID=A0A1B2HGG6_9PSEU|nr:FAD-dependent oxidoreductase [Lentzea guizhouensis]ANZ36828.1 2,4-dichlorophenol 6-monooxygenase [Lentzea guizhouensis]